MKRKREKKDNNTNQAIFFPFWNKIKEKEREFSRQLGNIKQFGSKEINLLHFLIKVKKTLTNRWFVPTFHMKREK